MTKTKTKMKTKTREHVVLGNNSLRCLNCGDEYHIDFSTPVSINMLTGMSKGFTDDHEACKPSERGRARFEFTTPSEWLSSWDTGQSSITIYNFMQHCITADVAVPYDPSDFGRCYRLLKAFPKWRARLDEMGSKLSAWTELAKNWAELERLFEEESPSKSCPKLYARLQELASLRRR